MSKTNQKHKLLQYLREHKTITRLEASRKLGIMELSSRLIDLERNDGVKISSDWITVTNRYGDKVRVKQYRLTDGYKEQESTK